MGQDTPQPEVAELADVACSLRIVEEIGTGSIAAAGTPQAEMNVGAASRLLQKGFGGKRCQNAMPPGYTTSYFTHQYRVVGRPKRVGMPDGYLLLTGSKLRHKLLY